MKQFGFQDTMIRFLHNSVFIVKKTKIGARN